MFKAHALDLSQNGEKDIRELITKGVDAPSPNKKVVEIPDEYKTMQKDKKGTGLQSQHIGFLSEGIREKHKFPPNKKIIFVYPANSLTAKLKPSARHNQGSGGLAEVFEIPGIDNAGIPTITQPGGTTLASQEEIKHYIAQLYALAAQGHLLVLPKFGERYAFGGGVSPEFLTSEQNKLIQKELKDLEAFLAKVVGKDETQINALIEELGRVESGYAAAFVSGRSHKDMNPDDIFHAYAPIQTTPVISTGNAETFKFKDLAKIQTLCGTLNLQFTKISDVQIKITDAANNNEMLLEPHRVAATKEVNEIAFYLNMIKIAAENSHGKTLHFFAPEKEKEKIAQAIAQAANLKPPIKVEIEPDLEKFKKFEDEAKQALGGTPVTPAPGTKSTTPPTPTTTSVVDPFKDNLLVKALTGDVAGYKINPDKSITLPADTTDIQTALAQLGLLDKTHFDIVAKDQAIPSLLRLHPAAIDVLKNKLASTTTKSSLLEQAISKLAAPKIIDVRNLLAGETAEHKSNPLIQLFSQGGNSDEFQTWNTWTHKINSSAEGLKITLTFVPGLAGESLSLRQNGLYAKAKASLELLGLAETSDFKRVKSTDANAYDHILITPPGMAKLKAKTDSPTLVYICRLHEAAAILSSDDEAQKKQLLRDVLDGRHELFGFHEKNNDGNAEIYLKIKNYGSAEMLNDGVIDSLLDFASETLSGKKLGKDEQGKILRNGMATAQSEWSAEEQSHAATISREDLAMLKTNLAQRQTHRP